ncbi:MAG: type II toxin-antitoxin system VapC family toxin [Anaerolineae bacterium]
MATTDDKQRVFLDTNILIRSTVKTAPMHLETRIALDRLWKTRSELWISRQVLREYMVNVTRHQTFMQPLPISTVLKRVRFFMGNFELAEDSDVVTDNLLRLISTIEVSGKQIHDANIVATMQAYGIDQLLTNNVEDFTHFASLITILPIVSS